MLHTTYSHRSTHVDRRLRTFVAVAVIGLGTAGSAAAQEDGWISGTVRSDDGEPVSGASVQISELGDGALTSADGGFLLGPVPAGRHTVGAASLGYGDATRAVDVAAGDTVRVDFTLAARPVELAGVDVSVLRPDMQPESEADQEEIREANPRDVGDVLRTMPGMSSVRRGPVGLDPAVRGLRETEVGVYLDGTRIFPGGAARMDSPLSHLDPSALENIQVVKGPYALTWGAGNMSAIRVETFPVPPPVTGPLHGRVLSGYDSNLSAAEGAASLFGTLGDDDRFSYWSHGVWREGDDYAAGNGDVVPADFLSREARGKVGVRTAPGSHVTLSAGYQDQRDIDYPGRLLNADFFETYNLKGAWTLERDEGLLRAVDASAYVNDVDHGMDNDGKPTAEPMEGRIPPFALDVRVNSGVNVGGGRLAATLTPAEWSLELGGDLYRAHRSAVRTIARRDNGMVMFEDLMWPDAVITDAGAFLRAEPPLDDGLSAQATVRLDLVGAAADTASEFFLDNASRDLDAREANLSGAVTVSALLSTHWSVSAGLGSVVRTADATERYSDRIPASKAQTSAEFMGNPALAPERSTQADLWLEADYPRLSIYVNGFARRMDDYITLQPTALPERLPLSPETVYRYVNGRAMFWGGEASATYAVAEPLTLTAGGSYLRGRDETLDEPALGVAPLRGDFELRWEPAGGPFYVEAALQAVAGQDRVAATRGEQPTDGYATADLRGGVELLSGTLLRFGVKNITDAHYVNHLNAKNPFTAQPIAEPGRVIFARLNYAF